MNVDPDAAREAAEEILSRPEYREPQPTLVDRVLEAIGDLLSRAIGTLTGGGAGSAIGTAFTVLLLALAAWLLVRALGAPGGRGRRRDRSRPEHGTTAPDDPGVWAEEAERLARAGDHRAALRCRYQELVAHLVRERAVGDDPARTPAELRAELSDRRPDLSAVLRDVTDRFEEVWYGGAEVDAAAYTSFATATASVRQAVREPAVEPAGLQGVGP